MAGKDDVIVSRAADRMLIEHVRFLANVSIPAANRMADEFEALLQTLEENPYLFSIDEDFRLPDGVYRRALFARWYKVLFLIEGQNVYVDAVLDCRRDNSGGVMHTRT